MKNEISPEQTVPLDSLVREDPISVAIRALSEINAQHLDEAGIQKLTQLFFWVQQHQGSIFVKTVGKMDLSNNQAHRPAKAGERD